MRLRRIKVAGFKSFVDPTTITLPPGIIGIVGPNGCGKSNVIDAVRWVMGEISAKHLRGDSMADVVFNGSTSRKLVGQASVELIFDNSDGRLGGQYAAYGEIAVRRQVVRDGPSSYYLNGTRCRRRDVVSIFLGTGLGPRSYAIIEQGMISRLIEARPEELREFLEEAAGISKYKERRRETETRLRHCQENLDRLNDLRGELDKQLASLKRQVTIAEKYRGLKQEQRHMETALLVLRWRALEEAAMRQAAELQAQENSCQAALAEKRRLENSLEKARVRQAQTTEAFNVSYRQVVDIGSEIARCEENIAHLKARRYELSESFRSEEALLAEVQDHVGSQQQRLEDIAQNLRQLEPELAGCEASAAQTKNELAEHEQVVQGQQAEWERVSAQLAEATRNVHVQRTQIEHIEQRLMGARKRLGRLQEERAMLHPDALQEEIDALQDQLADRIQVLAGRRKLLDQKQLGMRDLRERAREVSLALHAARGELQEARGQLSSLRALQQEALGKRPGAVLGWLEANNLADLPRLAEKLEVVPGWERALETALGSYLEAICVVDLDALDVQLEDLTEGALTLLEANPARELRSSVDSRSWCQLVEKLQAPWMLGDVLEGIYVAESLAEALRRRPALRTGESMVTRTGEWVGPSWVQVQRSSDGTGGVLGREQEMRELFARCATLEEEVDGWEVDLEATQQQLGDLEADYARLQTALAEEHRQQVTFESKLVAQRNELEQAQIRQQAIASELKELQEQAASDEEQLHATQLQLQDTSDRLESLRHQHDELTGRREDQLPLLAEVRHRWQQQQDGAYRVRVQVESLRTELKSLEQVCLRDREQADRLQSRCEALRQALAESEQPLREFETGLEARLLRKQTLDEHLGRVRQDMAEAETDVQQLESERAAVEQQLHAERAALEPLQMGFQETRVRRDTVAEQIAAAGSDLAALHAELPRDASEEVWSEKRDRLTRSIERLGPINLAAIDEWEQQAERKGYLDAQHADLVEALTTLKEAIRKIDHETKTRFQDTFDRVNARFGALFGRLFGGGHAYLEMTGGDVLDTGISIMARPPGKRNSTIHLLSGGEKALTAVAVVFAVFELNPAPFCLLDEVDAPLDDANVGRFCELVKEMSERLQLVVVTHNKTTMETSQHLIGVTMKEPGVSRLVAVDVEEAVRLAAM